MTRARQSPAPQSPDQLVGRGLKPMPAPGVVAYLDQSPDQLVGRGLKQEEVQDVGGGDEESPDQLVGRGLKLHIASKFTIKLAESPDQLVGRGLKQQHPRRMERVMRIARPIGRAWIETWDMGTSSVGESNRPTNWSGVD